MASKIAKNTDVSECVSISEVLQKTDTGWEPVVKSIAAVQGDSTDTVAIQPMGYRAIVRPDNGTMLGCVTDRYRPNSHVYHVGKLDTLVRNGDLRPAFVSVWDGGRVIAYQFRATLLDMTIRDGDKVSPLLTLAFFHDGKGGDMSFFADFRWFCKNQMGSVAKANTGNAKAWHKGNVMGNYDDMLMRQIASMQTDLKPRYDAMRRMAENSVGGRNLLAYFARSFGMVDPDKSVNELWTAPSEAKGDAGILKKVLHAYREDDCGAPGSIWQAYNAMTRYLSHEAGTSPATRAARVLLGSDQKVLGEAYNEATKLLAA
jgi:hypothetical protein